MGNVRAQMALVRSFLVCRSCCGDLLSVESNTNINNELLTLKSPTLMTEVVQRLGLNESYTVRKGLRTIGLYKCNPIVITYRHLDETPVGFTIDISSKETRGTRDGFLW